MAELRRNRDLIGGIVLVFFLLFSLAPAGIMPVATPEGIKVVICTSHGPLEITTEPKPAKPEPAQGNPCGWAMAHGLFNLADAPRPLSTGSSAFLIIPDRPMILLAHAKATGLPPSTGPPLAS